MGGALALGEYGAGAIIAVMLTGGTALERFAIARARRELSALLKRAPRIAHRRAGADIIDVEVAEVVLGWFSAATARASRSKRATQPGSSALAADSTFTATWRWRRRSKAA